MVSLRDFLRTLRPPVTLYPPPPSASPTPPVVLVVHDGWPVRVTREAPS